MRESDRREGGRRVDREKATQKSRRAQAAELRGGSRFSPAALGRSRPAGPLKLGFQPPGCELTHFYRPSRPCGSPASLVLDG